MRVETAGRGVLLPEVRLALDTHAPSFTSVVSHAHGDHIPWEATHAFASRETADILALRKPDLHVTVLPWREPTRVGSALVTLHPAGHVLGSALVHVEAPGGETLLYTGDTKARRGLTCPPAEFVRADTLVVESTFGLPIFRFPDLDAIERDVGAFARAALDEGAVPVFLGYALGKAQELCALLERQGVPTLAHGAVWNVCRVYERHGVAFGRLAPYASGATDGKALVVPPGARNHPMVLSLDARTAYCSGWARLGRTRAQTDADAFFPLSDHADFPGLLQIVEAVEPRRVYANHGYADVFSHLLRKEGVDARALAVGHEDEDVTRAEGPF